MTTAILDTNVLVQAVISSSRSASARTMDALFEERFRLCFSPQVVDEWLAVLSLPRMRIRHGMTDDELLEFLAAVLVNAERYPGEAEVSAPLARDITDTKLLSLALESEANCLVTNDRRHLLPLKRFMRTTILTPAAFLRVLDSQK